MTDDQRDLSLRPTDHAARRTALIAEIAARLRHACQHLSDQEFARLVADIAEMRLRFADINARHFALERAQGDSPRREEGERTDEPGA